jgi:thiol-disulfide isomerase/thioredoxin
MKKSLLIIIIIIALISIVSFYLFLNKSQDSSTQPGISDQSGNSEVQLQQEKTTNTNQDEKDLSGNYVEYSPEVLENASAEGKKIVLFFHAGWCPTCISAHKDFIKRIDEIPEEIIVVKTNYDAEKELKKKYNVTYQHTFVQIDANGELVTIWNGGDLDEILKNLK